MGYNNFVRCQLAASITSTDTSITLSSNTSPFNLPPTDGGTLVLADSINKPSKLEIITYTSRSGLVLTGVVRGAESTTAQSWPSSSYCYMSFTALMLTSFKADMAAALQTVVNKQDKHTNLTALSGITSGTGLFKRASDGSWVLDTTQYSTVTLASATPLAGSISGSVGTSLKAAKEDHTHPLQTSVSGNAGTATKLASPISFTFTGGATGSLSSFDGSGNVTINLTVDANGHTHGLSTSLVNGLMSSAQFTKLAGIADNANNYVHPTGAGYSHIPAAGTNVNRFLKSGTNDTYSWSLLSKTDVGLSNVDNTADVDKPLSTAVTNALANKVNTSSVGVANGLATLDANALVPSNQLPNASSSTYGVVKLSTDTTNTITANALSSVSNRTYQIQKSTGGGLVVNIPWTDTVYTHPASGVTTGSYTKVTVDTNGHIINGSNPTTVEAYGITNAVRTNGGANTFYIGWNGSQLVLQVDATSFGSSWPISISGNAPWSNITGKPTSISGYGITDATPSSHIGSTGTSHGVASTSVNGFMSTSQVVSLNTAISDISTLQTTVAGKEPSFTVLPVTKGGTGVSSISGVLKGNGTNQLSAATSNDIVALVPDATTSQAGKMTTSQVSSLNELSGLVSMSSGIVKKTLSTTGLDTYSTASISDLVTSANVVTNLNADLLDGLHVNNAGLTTAAHIPFIGGDGVMEVGKYIDFHTVLGNGFEVRLEAVQVTTSQSADLRVSGGRTSSAKVWHDDNHGAGSGLDADKLDGNHASAFALSGHTHGTATTLVDGFMSNDDKSRIDLLNLSSTESLTKVAGIDATYSGIANLSRTGSRITLDIPNGAALTTHRSYKGGEFTCNTYLENSSGYIQASFGVVGYGNLYGGTSAPGHLAARVYGGYNVASVACTSDVNNYVYRMVGTYSGVSVDATKSKVSSAYGNFIELTGSGETTTAGYVTNAYGLFIDASSIDPYATNLYSIYCNESRARGYLAGDLCIGVKNPNRVDGGLVLGKQYMYLYKPNDVTGAYCGADSAGVIAGLESNNTHVLHTPYGFKFGNAYSTTRESADSQTLDWYEEASVTLTSSGLTTNTAATAKLTRNGNLVAIDVPTITGAGTSTTFKLTGIPAQFRPLITKEFLVRGTIGGVVSICRAIINTSGEIQIYAGLSSETFSTTSSTRGINKISLSYQLH